MLATASGSHPFACNRIRNDTEYAALLTPRKMTGAQRLSTKIISILVAFFIVSLTAIGMTLLASWKLEGGAAAINDTGSLRIRTYRIAHQLARADTHMEDPAAFAARIEEELEGVEEILQRLAKGDPTRPLFVPQDQGIPDDVLQFTDFWSSRIRPVLFVLMNDPNPGILRRTMRDMDRNVKTFVDSVNAVVFKMEQSHVRQLNVLRASQALLVVLALVGTAILIRFFYSLVVRPVDELSKAIRSMEQEDFSARVPILTRDEFGELSEGFNKMATHLQCLYETLEERVAEKTHDLTTKNRELEILYATSGFLHEPNDIDSLCRGFLEHVQSTLGATASSVRLLDAESENLYITVSEGLDQPFLDREAVLSCGSCLCTEAARRNLTIMVDVDRPDAPMKMDTCRAAGFRAVSVAAITVNKRPIGVFNLYFRDPSPLDKSDEQLLETLGQQLGTAIQSLRLQARSREVAVFEERNMLARELHDSIAQGLAFLNLQVQLLERALENDDTEEMKGIVAMIRQGVQEGYDDVRELMVHFRARVDQQDLDAAISAALSRLAEQTGISTHFDVQGDAAPLEAETETQMLYIVLEALSNVRKHAQARSITVILRRTLEGLTVTVRDDGSGFDVAEVKEDAQPDHIGLEIMRERASRVGGRVEVRSSRGRGTEIRLEIPRLNEETH